MDYRTTPSVQVNLDAVERNIKRGVAALAAHGIAHRPHIKVHKCSRLARLQLDLGCKGITCAKLGEAEVMADAGIGDILVAYPIIGRDKLERYRKLLERGLVMRAFVNSVEGAEGMSALGEAMGRRLGVLLELDGGIGRGGLPTGPLLEEFARRVMRLPGLFVEGIACYSGDIYGFKTKEGVRARADKERNELLDSADRLRAVGLDIRILSGGSSHSIRCPDALSGLTEVRAGNYIFNDNALLSIGMVDLEDCALRVCATVIARPGTDTAILDAGSKTLSSDTVNFRPGYGYIVERPEAVIHKLNEEHGFVICPTGLDWTVGQVVTIVPNHACTVPNLCDEVYGMRNGVPEHILPVDARGKNR